MVLTIALVVVALLVVVLGIAAAKPNDFRVERTTRINAAPARIFPYIADFHRWADWSPYEKLDATMTKAHSGAASGPGAIYEWEGNSKVGKGRMEIMEASAPTKVAVKLNFMKPFVSHTPRPVKCPQAAIPLIARRHWRWLPSSRNANSARPRDERPRKRTSIPLPAK